VRVTRFRLGALVLVLTLPLLSLAACSSSGGLLVSARFSDVGDLSPGAPVMLADVTIGKVKGIRLDGREALVSMEISRDAEVPKDVTARVRRTSLLGEKVIDLEVPEGLPGNAPLLADGATIANTQVRADLEDLVRSGSAVLAPITASEVATLVDEGAKGFGGQGETIRGLIGNFRDIVHAYAGATDDIQSVIESLNQLNTTLAQRASAQGLAVQNGARALDVLREESDQLAAAIHALARLSVGSRGIMDAHFDEMTRFFAQMRTILGVLKSEQASIDGLLKYAPLHNRNVQMVEYQAFNQVLQDFVICGFNEDPSDPARTCNPPARRGD
jgi:phospholipid/cholesterol/gamma-HCH transport system substrate-binding protein